MFFVFPATNEIIHRLFLHNLWPFMFIYGRTASGNWSLRIKIPKKVPKKQSNNGNTTKVYTVQGQTEAKIRWNFVVSPHLWSGAEKHLTFFELRGSFHFSAFSFFTAHAFDPEQTLPFNRKNFLMSWNLRLMVFVTLTLFNQLRGKLVDKKSSSKMLHEKLNSIYAFLMHFLISQMHNFCNCKSISITEQQKLWNLMKFSFFISLCSNQICVHILGSFLSWKRYSFMNNSHDYRRKMIPWKLARQPSSSLFHGWKNTRSLRSTTIIIDDIFLGNKLDRMMLFYLVYINNIIELMEDDVVLPSDELWSKNLFVNNEFIEMQILEKLKFSYEQPKKVHKKFLLLDGVGFFHSSKTRIFARIPFFSTFSNSIF